MYTAAHLEKGNWTLIEDDPIRGIRRYRMDIDDRHAVQRTEYYRTEELLAHNAQDRSALAGQRWGEGQLVARMPLNVFWKELSAAQIEGDEKFVNRWLNDADHARFRVKEGKL